LDNNISSSQAADPSRTRLGRTTSPSNVGKLQPLGQRSRERKRERERERGREKKKNNPFLSSSSI
jgi:hypothetical protein